MPRWASLRKLSHNWGLRLLALGIVLLIVVHGLGPNAFEIDRYTMLLLALLLVLALYPVLKAAKVPGASLEFKDDLREGEKAAERVEARPEPESAHGHRRSLEDVHALFDIPEHLRDLADSDPNVALAGLRIELERALRQAHRVLFDEDDTRLPLSRIVSRLTEEHRFDGEQAELARSIIRVGNRAAHAEVVTSAQARQVFDWADTLNKSFGLGYSLNFAPNLDFEEQGLECEYEHCIENMPLEVPPTPDSCPMWGHECPAGHRRIVTCPAAQAWLAQQRQE